MHKLDVAFNRLIIAFVVAAGLIGSSLIGVFATSGPQVLGLNVVSAFGFFIAGVLGLWLMWGVFRSGRI
jgi:ubiquinone biosynthesis protein